MADRQLKAIVVTALPAVNALKPGRLQVTGCLKTTHQLSNITIRFGSAADRNGSTVNTHLTQLHPIRHGTGQLVQQLNARRTIVLQTLHNFHPFHQLLALLMQLVDGLDPRVEPG